MFQSTRSRRSLTGQAEIEVTPLIDMVFILLIFFVVTTSFVSEAGLSIQRPQASSAETLPRDSIPVTIDSSGRIAVDGKRTSLFSIRPLVSRRLRNEPGLAVVVVADKVVSADRLVHVMDEIRAAGVTQIALATERKD